MTSVLAAPFTPDITEPGVYDIPVDEYHLDPVVGGSLSSSGARMLLSPSCPAKFRYEQDHRGEAPPKRHFDIGHAAHQLVLGAGPDLVVVEAENYRTRAAQDAQDEAHARGAVPLLTHEHDQVQAMAAALREHPVAGPLFSPERGTPEVSLIWYDGPTGVTRRSRFDWLPHPGRGRLIIPDYKTCARGDLDTLTRAMHQHGYHLQADYYLAGAQALGLAGTDAAFVFVAQEKTPPYLVTIFEPDSIAMQIAAAKNRRALQIYAWCTENDHWPAYHEGIALLALPPWVERQETGDLA